MCGFFQKEVYFLHGMQNTSETRFWGGVSNCVQKYFFDTGTDSHFLWYCGPKSFSAYLLWHGLNLAYFHKM